MDLDVIIKAEREGLPSEADREALVKMQDLAKGYRAAEHDGNRKRIHLVLRNQQVADVLKRLPLSDDMAENVELYAYTEEDLWAMEMLGVRPESETYLDREAIRMDSRKTVHLVLFGVSNQSESLAVHTALTAHYPNYCRDNSLRTRITWVSDSQEDFHRFQQHYCNLLENSYRRIVTVNREDVECKTLEPKYKGQRDDFVDVEWEFVEGGSDDSILTYKLKKWANEQGQLLTIAFCYEDDERNVGDVLALPAEVHKHTPVWVRVKDETTLNFVKQSGQYSKIIPFGMENVELPDMSLFIRMAQGVNYAYSQMRETTEEEQRQGLPEMAVATEIPSEEELQRLWNNKKLNTAKRWSNIYNAFTLRSKMHSLGHPVSEWGTLFSISEKEVEALSEVEHNRWSVEELILGYMPTTEEEHLAIQKDIKKRDELKAAFKHDDLRSYQELGADSTGLSVVRYDMGLIRTLPLLAYMYHQMKENNDEHA